MFTTYIIIYVLLAALGIVEIATGFLKPIAGLGVHVFLSLFSVIFIVQAIILLRGRTADRDTQTKAVYGSHRLSLILATVLVLFAWLMAV